MGANEKHAATYHGGEYTPTLGHVRAVYVIHKIECRDTLTTEGVLRIEFDRWLEAVRAEAKAEAWDECMSSAYIDGVNRRVVNTPNPYKEQI